MKTPLIILCALVLAVLPTRAADNVLGGNRVDGGSTRLRSFESVIDSKNVQTPIEALAPDAMQGKLKSLQVTLSGTPGTVTTITLPDSARGFTIRPTTNAVTFAVNEDPAAVATSSSTTIAASAFSVGARVNGEEMQSRLLEQGTTRTLRLRSPSASTVVLITLF